MSPVPSTTLNRPRWRAWGGAAAALVRPSLFCGIGQALAQAANSIEATDGVQGQARAARSSGSRLKAPLANPPAGFAINNPPRIALDFPETGNGLGRSAQEVGDPALRSVNVVQAGNRTRVVFNLNKPQTFETQIEGNTVVVTLTEQAGLAADTTDGFAIRRSTAGRGNARVCATSISGAARTAKAASSSTCPDNTTGIDIRQQGKTLIVDFIKTTLPRNLERRLDVGDFATPGGQTIDTFAQGGNARMVIEPQGSVGAFGLPDRQPLHRRDQADPGGPEQADAGHARRLQGREAVAQLPERRSARGAAGHRRFHRPQHHHQRHGHRQPDAAASRTFPGIRRSTSSCRPRASTCARTATSF